MGIACVIAANRALAIGKDNADFARFVQPDIEKAMAGWK